MRVSSPRLKIDGGIPSLSSTPLHAVPQLSSVEDTAMLLHTKISFKDLLDWRFKQRRDSEYQGEKSKTPATD